MTAAPFRLHVPGLIDLVLVRDPDQIRWLDQHTDVVRELDSGASWLHRLINRRLRGDLAFGRGVLPVFVNRDDPQRAAAQARLHVRLAALSGQPSAERDRIIAYVAGEDVDIAALVQQWCGKLFRTQYSATPESYAAGKRLATWPSSAPWRAAADRRSGRLARAKRSIAELADQDLHCVHATSIGTENIVKTVRGMRRAAESGTLRRSSADAILRRCLAAPAAVLRGCKREIEAPFLSGRLTPRSVIVFQLARAYASSGALDDAFLGNSWSECPAREVVPDLLRTVWDAAKHRAHDDQTWLASIGSLGRRWRAIAH